MKILRFLLCRKAKKRIFVIEKRITFLWENFKINYINSVFAMIVKLPFVPPPQIFLAENMAWYCLL